MSKGWLLAVMALLMVFFAVPQDLAARPVTAAHTCHAAAGTAESHVAVLAQAHRWTCANRDWNSSAPATLLHFALSPDAEQKPRSFVSHISRFDEIDILVIDAAGQGREVRYSMKQARLLSHGPYFSLPLPETRAAPASVVVRITAIGQKNVLTDARLDSSLVGTGNSLRHTLLYAVICGLLCAPIFFNLAFYRVLREPFILWHLAIVVTLVGQVLLTTGLINALVELPYELASFMNVYIFSLVAGCAHMFTASFIEPGMMDERLRRLLRASALWMPVCGLVVLLPLPILQTHGFMLFSIVCVPSLLLIVLALFDSWRRGSRMARYQAVGWALPITFGGWRVFSYLTAEGSPDEVLMGYSLSLVIEVLATTMGTIGRLLHLRRERDRARLRADEMASVAGTDPLTGLENRRSIERRFAEYAADGFLTMAVIDLDHFKQVNDGHGHACGDRVLVAVANALAPDDDTRVIRMGGEEFLLLLRGPQAALRAERRRRAIPGRIAAEVTGLDRMVTASMGLVERDADSLVLADFITTYQHCDRLLYEAKRAGRNQTMREKVKGFGARRYNARRAQA